MGAKTGESGGAGRELLRSGADGILAASEFGGAGGGELRRLPDGAGQPRQRREHGQDRCPGVVRAAGSVCGGTPEEFSVVRVPSPEEEARRAHTRQREQLRRHRLSLAAQGRTALLLTGRRESNHWWKATRWARLQRELPEELVQRLRVYHRLIEQLDQEVVALTKGIEAAATAARPHGMGALTSQVVEREVGDWNRFGNRRQAGSYAGLTGGVSGSGERSADLSVTKAGNKRLRTALIELSWRLLTHQPDYW